MLFEKVECLASTYKSGGLSYKLPKRTRYIYIYIHKGGRGHAAEECEWKHSNIVNGNNV